MRSQDALTRRDHKNRTVSFTQNPLADAANEQLPHRATSMRTDNHYVRLKLGNFLQDRFYRRSLDKKRRCIETFLS